MTIAVHQRKDALREAGASEQEVEELLGYAQNKFQLPATLPALPLPDEAFVDTWRGYSEQAARRGIECLRLKLVQLAFPIEAGMSDNEEYQSATRRGVCPPEAVRGGLLLRHPEACRVEVYGSFTGGIGVISTEDRADFESLVRAFTSRNEPVPLPPSMGASMVAGYNNWHRIALLKQQFLKAGGSEARWPAEFQRIKAERDLYQDRFLLLSRGPYSGVQAIALQLSEEEWVTRSMQIRLGHECAHYFTKRIFGSMQNNLLDEVMADYAGLKSAFGCFRAEWMLLFLGLESYPHYREGGRVQNYRGTPRLSDSAFQILTRLVWQAAWNLESFDRIVGNDSSVPRALLCIGSMTIDELATPGAASSLATQYGSMTSVDAGQQHVAVTA